MNDLTTSVLTSALNGLAVRQRAIADNIANVQTPGYLAREVKFEGALAEAASTGQESAADSVSAVTTRSNAATRTDGNNVDLDDETVSAIDTNLRYSTMIEAMNHKFKLLRTAATRV